MPINYSPNMNLPIPAVGTTAGPDYATDVNSSFTVLDSHNHAPGSGVQINPSGLNINSVLTMNGNFLTSIAGLTLTSQSVTPAINTIYESGVDLFYVDGVGNNIQITANGGIAGTPGSISNLTSPASATYVAGSSTFVWQSDTSIAANMDFGSALLRNLSPNSTFALTLSPPANLTSNYTITLPSLPSTLSLMTLDASGNIAAPYSVSGGLNASILTPASITETQMGPLSVGTPELINGSVTPIKLSAKNIVVSPSCLTFSTTGVSSGNIPNLSLSITTSGRPVILMIQADSSGNAAEWEIATGTVNITITRDGTTPISVQKLQAQSGIGMSVQTSMTVIDGVIVSLAAGTHTYVVSYAANSSNFAFNWSALVAYEL